MNANPSTIVATLALAALFLLAGHDCATANGARALEVYDGDTFKVTMDGEKKTIRLYGIDAPESEQEGHLSAARFLRRLVFGNVLEIKILEKDWTGRFHAIVTRVGNEMSVNAAMVANGYSWVHAQKCNTEVCGEWKALESKARKYKLGVWSGYDLVPPWEFKREGN